MADDKLSKEEARIAAAMNRKPSAKSFQPKPQVNQALEDVKRLAAEEQRAAAARGASASSLLVGTASTSLHASETRIITIFCLS